MKLKILIPVVLLGLGSGTTFVMIASRPEPQSQEPLIAPPAVRAVAVRLRDLRLTVRSQGTVSPRTQIVLAPEVSGVVASVSPSFTAGGFFSKGVVLLEIDRRDFESAGVLARAEVARARHRLAQEEAEAAVALEEWKELGRGEGTELSLRKPQIEEARALLAAAEAALERAQRDLERTRIAAPFAGRVRSRNVDAGQFVTRGAPLATIYSVDAAEVRLPLSDEELAYLDLPLDARGETRGEAAPEVAIRARFAGSEYTWQGRIVRVEAEIDRRTRMAHAIARIDDPYSRPAGSPRPPLAVGMFVEAEIAGRAVENVVVLPRTAFRDADHVLVIDAENRLRFRKVSVLRFDGENAIVGGGLVSGERVCVSPLAAVADGMPVRVFPESGSDAGAGAGAGAAMETR